MAQIKLSAFATDIKGKVGGTVFSSNGGGLYIKNKSNGQRGALLASANAKGKFGNASQVWRTLTPEQQQAWKDASALYPTVDKFGATRYLSGRALCLQMNANLLNNGSSGILTPLPPRSLPAVGELTVNTPVQFQLKANKAFSNFSPTFFGALADIQSINTVDILKITSIFSLCVQVRLDMRTFAGLQVNDVKTVFMLNNELTTSYGLYLRKVDEETFTLQLNWTNGIDDFVSESVNSFEIDSLFHSIILRCDGGLIADNTLLFDASEISMSVTTPYAGVLVSDPMKLYLGDMDVQQSVCGTFSDLRGYTGVPVNFDASLISKGYVLDSEAFMNDLTSNKNDVFKGYDACPFVVDLAVSLYNGYTDPLSSFDAYQIPAVDLVCNPSSLPDTKIIITCTKSLSFGNTATSIKQKSILRADWYGVSNLDLASALYENIGYILGNSALEFQAFAVDMVTGQQTLLAAQSNPRKTRFKAGSELTEKVN